MTDSRQGAVAHQSSDPQVPVSHQLVVRCDRPAPVCRGPSNIRPTGPVSHQLAVWRNRPTPGCRGPSVLRPTGPCISPGVQDGSCPTVNTHPFAGPQASVSSCDHHGLAYVEQLQQTIYRIRRTLCCVAPWQDQARLILLASCRFHTHRPLLCHPIVLRHEVPW